MKDRLFQIWFSLRLGVANREFLPILEKYESMYQLFSADEEEIAALPCGERLKRALRDKNLDESSRIMEYCRKNRVGILFYGEENYPASLRTLDDPPLLLYYRGEMPDVSRRLCISVVGTRTMSEYGKRMAYKIGYELAAANAVVVSGMALGVDSVAAAGAIAAKGSTVAVLGCGIDVTYPAEHAALMKEIMRHGAVITEFPPATRPKGFHFPIRNRIISGLGQGTVVVEADEKSGALITARNAIAQGKDIYAVPGNVGEANTAGTNQLIHDGAAVVLRARDILDNYTFLYRDTLNMARLTTVEGSSEPDDRVLARLGVCVKKARAVKAETPVPAQAERPAPRRASAPKSSTPAPLSAPSSEAASPTPVPAEAHPRVGDMSEKALASLSDMQRRIFTAMPLDQAVPVDYLMREGFTMAEVMSAMTLLEIKGLVVSLPGGLYVRK